jgi:hypothetical protein
MSFLLTSPDALIGTASNVADIGSTLTRANAAAAAQTNSLVAAAADEVSTQIAALFSEHGLEFQQLNAQASAFHERFVQALTVSAQTYAAAEANAAQLLSSGSAVSGGGFSGLAGISGTPANTSTGAVGATGSASAPAAPNKLYNPYLGYYGYAVLGIIQDFFNTILNDPINAPYYAINVILAFPYYWLGGGQYYYYNYY